MDDLRTDEDRIVESLIIDGSIGLYEDMDFLPSRQSLYNNETVIPEYDDEIFQAIEWCRPQMIFENPCYFNASYKQLAVNQGSLPDKVFLGTLMAICAYSKYDLIENIFASRPEDFTTYGIYTCRFYVDGDWVEVITDTNLPCLRNLSTGAFRPAYGNSENDGELWVALVEKAFAKAMGSYEEIPNIKVQKALLHLTGGSIQQISLKDEVAKNDGVSDTYAWNEFKKRLEGDCLVLLLPSEKKMNDINITTTTDLGISSHDSAALHDGTATHLEGSQNSGGGIIDFFIPDMLYSVILCKEIGGYELVLMHNPWKNPSYAWTGDWSDASSDWDLYPDILSEIERDPNIPWRKKQPNGYFWIQFRQLAKYFNRAFWCKLFPNEKYNFYCARGECRGMQAGGPLVTVRDHEMVTQEAVASKSNSMQKATAAYVIDGDASWFTNPQYRITTLTPSTIYVSVVPLTSGEDENDNHHASSLYVTITSSPKLSNQPISLWDVSGFEVVAADKTEGLGGPIRVKGQETSVWGLKLDPRHYYHIIPNAPKRAVEGDYILRVFSTNPITLESVQPPISHVASGEWRKVGDLDTTGGPLKLSSTAGGGETVHKENAKWCQNPQYHVEVVDPFGKEELYLKVVLRRTDKSVTSRGHVGKHGSHNQNISQSDQKKLDAMVGLVICKAADVLEDSSKKIKKRQPRQNILGESILAKASTLKKPKDHNDDKSKADYLMDAPKVILRKLTIDTNVFHLTTSYSSRTESCVYFPKLPRSWIPNGFMIIPSLSEKGVKGHFDLEVYSSEPVVVNQLPETYSRTIAGEWIDNCAGGSHVYPTFRKNPKYTLKFHYPVNSMEPSRVRITLAKYGQPHWRTLSRKDTVGCMIGFYIFVNSGGEVTQVYESTFSPDDEISTEPSFTLAQLAHNEFYSIMPTTYADGKIGSFVLSILSEYEFNLTKDK